MWSVRNTVGGPYLILAILFSVVGVVQCVRWANAESEWWRVCLFNFLPATVFFVAYLLSRKWRRRVFHAIAIPLCVLAVGFWGSSTVVVEWFISETTEVTDIRKYDKILDAYWGPGCELVSHFPRPIPADAQGIRFSFLPAFLQGGTHIQLRYSLPSEQIEERYAYFAQKKTKSFFGGTPTTSFYIGDTKDGRFPDDYEIMIFDRVLKEEDQPAGYWNHGQSHGVAISKQRHEIIYWAESW